MIPKQVSHAEFLAAIKPLFDLIGTDPENVVMSAPISILPGRVDPDLMGVLTFAHAAGSPTPGRIASLVDETHPQGDDAAELVSIVSVDIVHGAV